MKNLKLIIIAVFGIALVFTLTFRNIVRSQERMDKESVNTEDQLRRQKFTPVGVPESELSKDQNTVNTVIAAEAPTGFDNLTNGFDVQGPPFESINEDNVVANRSFNDNRFIFEEVETIANGIGPTYNAQSCRECHQNVVTGGASQIAEHRTGHTENGAFFESLGGTLIHSRATFPDIVERVNFNDEVRTFRLSTNTLGDGFIEAIANDTIFAIRNNQPASLRGTILGVPVLEANSFARVGRFGWKNQHASLESFSGDAYLNEMGITNPLFINENTSSGVFVGFGTPFDPVAEPEDNGDDLKAFANFIRSTKAPSRGPITNNVVLGEQLFNQIGCAVCHVNSITTAPPGTLINGGAMTVGNALGNKIIHPYSDFLLHDIGTGDGIPFLPTPDFASTANQIRTAPLWALRTRNRLMHDGLTFTVQEAVARHAGQATSVRNNYNALTTTQKNRLIAFLYSL